MSPAEVADLVERTRAKCNADAGRRSLRGRRFDHLCPHCRQRGHFGDECGAKPAPPPPDPARGVLAAAWRRETGATFAEAGERFGITRQAVQAAERRVYPDETAVAKALAYNGFAAAPASKRKPRVFRRAPPTAVDDAVAESDMLCRRSACGRIDAHREGECGPRRRRAP
jgi:hypothetical protein